MKRVTVQVVGILFVTVPLAYGLSVPARTDLGYLLVLGSTLLGCLLGAAVGSHIARSIRFRPAVAFGLGWIGGVALTRFDSVVAWGPPSPIGFDLGTPFAILFGFPIAAGAALLFCAPSRATA